MVNHRIRAHERRIERSQARVRKKQLSAWEHMKLKPHFVFWAVQGCEGTASFCVPDDNPPFDLRLVLGIVDTRGVLRSTDCSDLYVERFELLTVRIKRDKQSQKSATHTSAGTSLVSACHNLHTNHRELHRWIPSSSC